MIKFEESEPSVRGRPITCRVDHNFFRSWSRRMAWCLGLMATDGCLTSRKRLDDELCSKGVHFGSADYELVRKFVEFTGSTYVVKKIYQDGRHIFWKTQITNNDLYDVLVALGIKESKSLDLNFPSDYSDNWMPDYVRGCWDGDGGVYWRPRRSEFSCSFVSCSKNFIYGVDSYLIRALNLSTHKISTEFSRINCLYRIQLFGENARKLCRWMYHDNMQDAYLMRKYQEWLNYKQSKIYR